MVAHTCDDRPTLWDKGQIAQQRKVNVWLPELGVQGSMLRTPHLLEYSALYIATYAANQTSNVPRELFCLVFKPFYSVHI